MIMKKTIILMMLCMAVLTAAAQRVMVPGKGGIDVEQLNKPFNLDMDVSQLGITELRILRNSFWARKGYAFRDAFLRGVYQNTSWYGELMWNAYDDSDEGPTVTLTAAEQAFTQRLSAREKELLKDNFTPQGSGWRINMQNVVNTMQLEDFDAKLERRLADKGFAIVPAKEEQLFHVYEKNDYCNFPSFVTTDLYLQLYHLYFDCLLRDVEQHKLYDAVSQLCERGYQLTTGNSPEEQRLHIYFDVARQLLSGGKGTGTVQEEVEAVNSSTNRNSEYLGYMDAEFPYSLFRPRGHYTRNETLSRYFRAMMWLQTVPFGTDKPEQLNAAVVLAELTGGDATMKQLYDRLFEPMTYLFGTPDNITIMQVYQLMQESGKTARQLISSGKAMKQLRQRIEATAEKQTRIRPKFETTSRYKINLMPQRYMPDAEVLQEMVDYDNEPTKRAMPSGLDIMAAMGVGAAEHILVDELGQARQWEGFTGMLSQMKELMQATNWEQSIGTRWIAALKTVNELPQQNLPFFMQSPEWQKKNLNAALASWAELKHDAILYAKQPFGAECGGGGPPAPIVKGYVEPNVAFWQKAIDLLDATERVLKQYDFMTEKGEDATGRMRDEAEFLLAASQKELAGKRLSDEEYSQLEYIGATFEDISLGLVREPNMELFGWDDVQGTDRKVALIADVYTANAFNNPDKNILYAAVGMADEIYVVVEVEGYLYLMRGGVLSYREVQRPTGMQRMTDEEWHKNLEENPDEGRPAWMDDVLLRMKEAPKANEKYFYSTGC